LMATNTDCFCCFPFRRSPSIITRHCSPADPSTFPSFPEPRPVPAPS
jgi:hypothetical protein